MAMDQSPAGAAATTAAAAAASSSSQSQEVKKQQEVRTPRSTGGGDAAAVTPSSGRTQQRAQDKGRARGPCKGDNAQGGTDSPLKSFGPFLDGPPGRSIRLSVTDIEEPVTAFAGWALGKWEHLHELFGYKDKHGLYTGRQGVTATEFVTYLRQHGFEGDSWFIFREIQREASGGLNSAALAAELAGAEDEGCDSRLIFLPQFLRFEQRVKSIGISAAGEDCSPAGRFMKLLRQQRGCLLRAWRLDLDHRGIGRVAFNDFSQACRRLGFGGDARTIWASFRPDGGSAALEFRELDYEEAVNLERFGEALWSEAGFDLDRAWSRMDSSSRGVISCEEFALGARKLGFEGNAKVLFRGLDSTGLGRLWRMDFDYMLTVSFVSGRATHSASLIRTLLLWAQGQFGTVDDFLDKLCGVPPGGGDPQPLSVSDLAARLTALGYPEDALHAAMIAARSTAASIRSRQSSAHSARPAVGHSNSVSRAALKALLTGLRGGSPPRRRTQAALLNVGQEGKPNPPKPRGPPENWRPRKMWRDSVDNLSEFNTQKPASVRHYFSVPDRHNRPVAHPMSEYQPPARRRAAPGFSQDDGQDGIHGISLSQSAGSLPARQRAGRVSAESPPRAELSKPGWNGSLYLSTEANEKLPTYCRRYFSNPAGTLVKEEIHRNLANAASRLQPGGDSSMED